MARNARGNTALIDIKCKQLGRKYQMVKKSISHRRLRSLREKLSRRIKKVGVLRSNMSPNSQELHDRKKSTAYAKIQLASMRRKLSMEHKADVNVRTRLRDFENASLELEEELKQIKTKHSTPSGIVEGQIDDRICGV